jgi:hypothetical protein
MVPWPRSAVCGPEDDNIRGLPSSLNNSRQDTRAAVQQTNAFCACSLLSGLSSE